MSEHDHGGCNDPECVVCRDGAAAVVEREQRALEEHGWYAHYVKGPKGRWYINAHTHFLPKTFGHRDLQIVAPLPPEVVSGIFHAIVSHIRDGDIFVAGSHLELGNTYAVEFSDAVESARNVLRVILLPPPFPTSSEAQRELFLGQAEAKV